MFKKTIATLLTAFLVCSAAACGNTASGSPAAEEEASSNDAGSSEDAVSADDSASAVNTDSADDAAPAADTASAAGTEANAETASAAGAAANTLAEDEEALVATYAEQFEQLTYTDSESGLSITYNLFLPEGYDASASYPMVVFIGDSSCAGSDATVSLTQGRGGLVWATEEWQSVYPTIVAVPTYPETILDDHGSYTTTEYVELTKRYIDYMCSEYAVDTDRIYGTGQSMGCMTTLILASEYPDLYAACMFVDGQWDISTLSGLEDQTFVYFAAEDDTNAWNGAQEVMEMFDSDSVSYAYAQWDGNWSVDELSAAAQDLFSADENQYFISWATGTIEPVSGMGGSGAPGGGFGGPDGSGSGSTGGFAGPDGSGSGSTGSFGGPDGSGSGSTGGPAGPDGSGSGSTGGPAAAGEGMSGGTNSSSYHMASFDYAYNCVAVMEWLFRQAK